MSDQDRPQIYLMTPPAPDRDSFGDALARVLDAAPVACLRLSLASEDADEIARLADLTRETAHARDIPLVIDRHLRLVTPHGLDGVHFFDGARNIRDARKELGTDAIIGTYCADSRHEGMNAGEAGADYVSFGPVDPGPLGSDDPVPAELFEWWSQMIELPVVAEGGLTDAHISALAPITDFFALGAEIWNSDDPAARLREISALLG
ncbi:MAG: thiamine phosphate synthase [Mangrovicoccus sp.]|nr:thiamine phosphate synthase [Mangrovicoccus sp.]